LIRPKKKSFGLIAPASLEFPSSLLRFKTSLHLPFHLLPAFFAKLPSGKTKSADSLNCELSGPDPETLPLRVRAEFVETLKRQLEFEREEVKQRSR